MLEPKFSIHFYFSLIFVFLFYALDSIPLYYTFSKSTAFNSNITESLLAQPNVLLSMIISVIGLLLALTLSLSLLTYIFKVRHTSLFFLLVFIYSYSFNLIEQPAIFDDFIYANYYIQLLNNLASYNWIYLIVLLILTLLNISFFYEKSWTRNDLFLASTANIFLFYFFFVAQKPLDPSAYQSGNISFSSSKSTKNPFNIIFLGIDSLNESSLHKVRKGTALNLVLENSTTFRSSISPVANTRPAYSSILSGKNPPDIEQRFPLRRLGTSGQVQLENSPLNDFKKNGYSIHYMLDDASYNNPEKGDVFSSVDAPANTSDMRKFVYPILLRNRVLFTFFNNDFGNLILPGMYANFAYTYSYKISGFKDQVNNKIKILSEKEQPFLLFVHTSALHFPGNYRYPYYVKGGPQSREILGFGSRAPYLNAVSDTLPPPGLLTAQFYPKLYTKGVEMVTNHFINPIFEYLVERKLHENTIVVLFSDHGESFWNEYEIPRLKLPNHGTFLLGEDHSPRTFLSIYTPYKQATKIDNDLPLVDILPYVCRIGELNCSQKTETLQSPQSIYTETGMFPLKLFNDQFFFKRFKFSELFSLEDGYQVFLSKEATKPALIQKSRAVYSYPYRLTLYLANDGYRLFLCDYIKDKNCSKNLVYSETSSLERLFGDLMLKLKQDIVNGYIPSLNINKRDPLYASFSPDPNNDHLSLVFAISSLNRNPTLNLSKSIKILISLTNEKTTPSYIRSTARYELKKICNTGILGHIAWGQTPENPQKSIRDHDYTVCDNLDSLSHDSKEKGAPPSFNPHKKNEFLIEQLRKDESLDLLTKAQNLNLTIHQKKIIEAIVFFKNLRSLNPTAENAIERISIFLKKNYKLSSSLELREEFDLFWLEAFNFMKTRFGQKGIYHLILFQLDSFRISNNYFFTKVYPFFFTQKSQRDIFFKKLEHRDFDESFNFKKSIISYLVTHYFCIEVRKPEICDMLKKKEALISSI